MAHIWEKDGARGWNALPLDRRPVVLTRDGARPVFEGDNAAAGRDEALLILQHDSQGQRWALVAPADANVRVNCQPLLLGIRILQDKDAVQVGGGDPHYFATERCAQVELFEGTESVRVCPRCKQAIGPGCAVVKCPGPRCAVVHHESPELELPCWTGYDHAPFETCAMCEQPALLGAGYRWTPDEL